MLSLSSLPASQSAVCISRDGRGEASAKRGAQYLPERGIR